MKLSQLGEFGLIDNISKLIGKPYGLVRLGIGDDCAAIQQTTNYLLLTTDTLVEGIHFQPQESYFHLGQKAMLANISDISAMGGWPTYALVTVGLPADIELRTVDSLARGMIKIAKQHKIQIVGGDTVKAPQIIISITLLGEVEKKCLVTRSGAKVGDAICVTGEFGGPAMEKYSCLKGSKTLSRQKEARIIAKAKIAHAMIDSSDGLVRSVREICKASKVGARIDVEKVPRAKGATREQALYGGEEYELVFTCDKSKTPKFATVVGEIAPKGKGNLAELKPGFEHFK